MFTRRISEAFGYSHKFQEDIRLTNPNGDPDVSNRVFSKYGNEKQAKEFS